MFEDQLAAVEKASRRYGDGERNLALLTDGLRAEREQGITIDVAHRYFATPHRSFIVADTPGHAQYTRNMVTGASTADVAIVLVDARHGVVEQTRRHAFIASLLGVQAIALAVNKMDLVDWDEGEFDSVAKELAGYVEALPTPGAGRRLPDQRACSATTSSTRLGSLTVVRRPGAARLARDLRRLGCRRRRRRRLDVQRVIRPQGSDFRGFAGRLAGGSLASAMRSPCCRAVAPAPCRASNGSAARSPVAEPARPSRFRWTTTSTSPAATCWWSAPPRPTELVSGHVCWMIDQPLREGSRYWFKHGTRVGRAVVDAVEYRHDLHTLEPIAADQIELNDLAMVRLSLSEPIVAVAVRDQSRRWSADPRRRGDQHHRRRR